MRNKMSSIMSYSRYLAINHNNRLTNPVRFRNERTMKLNPCLLGNKLPVIWAMMGTQRLKKNAT